jgi:putative DNA primase/helicase
MRAGDVFKDADGCGFSKRSIQRAADKLGVDRRKEGMKGGWVWRLPLRNRAEDDSAPPKMPEDAEQNLVSPSRLRAPSGEENRDRDLDRDPSINSETPSC